MTHKFEIKNMHKLDNEWRRNNLPPASTLLEMDLHKDDIVADIGCGVGYFTISVAEIIDPFNRVYAMDISLEMLTEVERRAVVEGITNIVGINTKEYDFILPDEEVTFALMVNILHEIEDKECFLKEANRILKHKGKIAIIEFEKKQTEMGPAIGHRIAESEVISLLNELGFVVEKRLKFADCFYGILALKE